MHITFHVIHPRGQQLHSPAQHRSRPAECLVRAVSPEEDWARARAMNLDVTGRAICVLRVLVVRRASRLNSTDAVVHAVACQTQLVNGAVLQQTRI